MNWGRLLFPLLKNQTVLHRNLDTMNVKGKMMATINLKIKIQHHFKPR